MKYFTQTYRRFGVVALVLSLTIASAAPAAKTAFTNTNDPTTTPEILRLSPGHSYRFNVDPFQSEVVVTAEVMGIEDSDTSPVSGWLDVTLAPGQSPFLTIHIIDLNLELDNDISLRYGLLGSAIGTDIGVDMSQAGSAASIHADDSFLQASNYLAGRGLFEYNFIIVGEGSVDLSTMGPVASDLTGLVWQDSTTIFVQMDIDIEYPLEVDGSALGTAWIQGSVVATAEVFWAPSDLYTDGLVNFRDFAVFADSWDSSLGDPAYNPECDLDQPPDGFIDATDLKVFADSWLYAAE